ncbi:MAG: hypothetical protein HY673_13895 [Chloroflexi bacterium]|nr:hypothetical protein [Chloroflexota bacterium]
MYDWGQISDMEYRMSLADLNAPKDILTKSAMVLVRVLTGATIVLVPLEIATTGIGGCLVAITFGVLILVLTLIWLPFIVFLLGTSWLWLHAWYLRPILLLPGAVVALLATIYIMLAPDPEKDAKHAKLCMAERWPLTWYLIKPPAEYYER